MSQKPKKKEEESEKRTREKLKKFVIGIRYVHTQPKQEGAKANAQYDQSLKQHTTVTLNLIIPKITHYIDEVMLHRLGLKVGICA